MLHLQYMPVHKEDDKQHRSVFLRNMVVEVVWRLGRAI